MDGDELVLRRGQFLYYLYKRGALGRETAVDRADVEVFLDIEGRDYDCLKSHLREAGLVGLYEVWVRPVGGATSSTREVWLTPEGVAVAESLVSRVRDQLDESSKGRIGFREPGEKEE